MLHKKKSEFIQKSAFLKELFLKYTGSIVQKNKSKTGFNQCFFSSVMSIFKIFTRTVYAVNLATKSHGVPASIYWFKVNNENTRTMCQICSKLTIKTPERRRLGLQFEIEMFLFPGKFPKGYKPHNWTHIFQGQITSIYRSSRS